MWALVIVVDAPPCRDHAAGMAQRWEQVLVEALLAHPSIEALHQAVLHRLSWCEVMPADLAVLLPFQHRIAGQFGAIVTEHHCKDSHAARLPQSGGGNGPQVTRLDRKGDDLSKSTHIGNFIASGDLTPEQISQLANLSIEY